MCSKALTEEILSTYYNQTHWAIWLIKVPLLTKKISAITPVLSSTASNLTEMQN